MIHNQCEIVTARRIYKLRFEILHRWILSRGYNFIVRHRFGSILQDTETGCKLFFKEKILSILDHVKDKHWFWDTEIMLKAERAQLNIQEVPCLFIRDPLKKTTVKLFSDILYYLKKVIRYTP